MKRPAELDDFDRQPRGIGCASSNTEIRISPAFGIDPSVTYSGVRLAPLYRSHDEHLDAHQRLLSAMQDLEAAKERMMKWTTVVCFAIVYWSFILSQVLPRG